MDCQDEKGPVHLSTLQCDQRDLVVMRQKENQLQSRREGADDIIASPLPVNTTCGLAAPPSVSDCDEEFESAVRAVREFLPSFGRKPYSWIRFRLSPAAYNKLVDFLLDDEAFSGLKTFYSIFEQEFAMGQETRLHATFSTLVVRDVLDQLSRFKDPFAQELARKIVNTARSRNKISIKGHSCEKSPDGSLLHYDARFPGTVIEVAHSQQKEDLPILAEEYITGSQGCIHCVIGFNFPYPTGNQATLSVWESKFTLLESGKAKLTIEERVKDEIFCNSDGSPNTNSPGLSLSLADLAPTMAIAEEANNLAEHLTEIHITAEQLCQYFDVARKADNSEHKGVLFFDGELEIGDLKHPRNPPAEEVSGNRLRQFKEQEERAEQRQEEEDSDYIDE